MASTDLLKDLIKPPFANYDVVVYFGCGLFALPFLSHYLGQHQVHLLAQDFGFEPPFVATLIAALLLLFSVYILGHIIAYMSSLFIEKAIDAFFGKVSTVVLLASPSRKGGANSLFRQQLRKGLTSSFEKSAWLSGVGRILAHLPVLLPYMVLIAAGVFGFYRSRVPKTVMDAADTKLQSLPMVQCKIAEDERWFKPLEQYVIANNPSATARMYNYLIISGLFRSLSFIFLVSAWFETIYLLDRTFSPSANSGILMVSKGGWLAQFGGWAAIIVVYLFSLFSYLKFQRRYVEEAIFSFVLTREEWHDGLAR